MEAKEYKEGIIIEYVMTVIYLGIMLVTSIYEICISMSNIDKIQNMDSNGQIGAKALSEVAENMNIYLMQLLMFIVVILFGIQLISHFIRNKKKLNVIYIILKVLFLIVTLPFSLICLISLFEAFDILYVIVLIIYIMLVVQVIKNLVLRKKVNIEEI